ncbi:uncharacterized mitochondrial protein AtMg00810-like [Rutidosis leptorrhynchoides]|uniref:uncharacterized mitochondrial protein AtMg00810-like n=1 Tax=Rutidosis leptorrhynchoides TaxID=125765 RepID=UPI003A99D7E7
MTLPLGYYNENDKRVCKLKRSLYGLKQAPRKWNEKLSYALIENGFRQSLNDYSLFIKTNNDVFIAILVYVDDIVVTGNNTCEINKFKDFLKSKFQIKDLGVLKYFLGIEVIRENKNICLSQRKYTLDLLTEFGLLNCKPIYTPIEPNLKFNNDDDLNDLPLKNITEYQRLIEKLIYLTLTIPDISYSVHVLSQFMHAPKVSHLKCALRVLRYLKSAPGKGICIRKGDDTDLMCYVDSDWGTRIVAMKSVTGYCLFLNGSILTWKSKKQDCVSRSSAEAEYRALADASCEVIWILKVLNDFGKSCIIPVQIHIDNSAAIKIANPVFHEKTKHFDLDLHFVRDKINKGVIQTKKVDSAENKADIFTKGLCSFEHNKMCNLLGLKDCFGN